MKKILSFLAVAASLSFCCACADDTPSALLGVWWWDSDLSADTYLSFAEENGVTEIYFCDSDFDDNTQAFIKRAHEKDMQV